MTTPRLPGQDEPDLIYARPGGTPYARAGLRVKLERINGITAKGLLSQPYYFQVPPLEEFAVEYGHDHSEYRTIAEGQFSRPGGVNLRTLSIDTLAVDTFDDGKGGLTPGFVTIASHQPIEDLRDQLIVICEAGSPFLLTAAHQFPSGGFQNWSLTEAGPEAHWPATMRRLRVIEKAGEGDTRYFSMDFAEYRDPVVSRRRRGRASGSRSKGVNPRLPVTVEIRARGNTRLVYEHGAHGNRGGVVILAQPKGTTPQPIRMTDLARAYYSDPTAWRLIARANDLGGFGANDNLLEHRRIDLGTKIKIPAPMVASI